MKKTITSLLLLSAIVVVISCKKQPAEQLSENDIHKQLIDTVTLPLVMVNEGNSYHGQVISAALIKQVAGSLAFQQNAGVTDSAAISVVKTVGDINTLYDSRKQPAVHIVNYKEGGYVVVSAERNSIPILAYSNKGVCNPNRDGLLQWFSGTKHLVEKVRLHEKSPIYARQDKWAKVMIASGVTKLSKKLEAQLQEQTNQNPQTEIDDDNDWDDPDPMPCDPSKTKVSSQIGPLLKTEWNQTGGDPYFPFNHYIPNKAAAGCSNVAVAQVMKYWKYPANWPWHLMPEGGASSDWTAWLMYKIGVSSGSKWGATPGAETSTNTNGTYNALKYTYGYKTVVKYKQPNIVNLMNDIRGNLNYWKPVIVFGENINGAEHMFVCDGYQYRTNHTCPTDGIYYYHLNWGWGLNSSGYFLYLGSFGYDSGVISVQP